MSVATCRAGTLLCRLFTTFGSRWVAPLLTDLLIFETVLSNSATKPYDGLLVRRDTLANPTD
jgi:hypothetical protein